MKAPVFFPFGEYLPDLPDYKNPGATVAKNVIPGASGYEKLQQLTAVTDAMSTRCLGAFAARDKDSNSYNYAGIAAKLYSQATTSMTDVSIGGGYTTATGEFWEFAKWGEKIIATNFTDAVQIITMGGANFGNLGGTPPKARNIAVIGQFVVLANLNEAGTLIPNKVRWSGINNEASWTASASTQSDSQELQSGSRYGGGWIQRVTGHGDYGVVFQEYSIWRMTYSGGPEVFRFDNVLQGIGTPSRNSVISVGDQVFFLGQEGFYKVVNGSGVEPIGAGKVDKTFLSSVDTANMGYVVGASDPSRRVVMWIYPTSGTVPNRAILYNWEANKWAHAEFDSEWLYSGLGAGYTLETLDTLSSSIDALTASLDSKEYVGGALQLASFDTSHKKATFSGTAYDATIETGEAELFPGRRAYVSGVRPLVETSGTLTTSVGTRNLLNSSYSYGSPSATHSETGIAPHRSNARYHRARVSITGDFDHADGVDVFAVATSGR